MKKKAILRSLLFLGIIIGLFIFLGSKKKLSCSYTEYKCDVKIPWLVTTIEINKGDEEFAKVSGSNILRLVTDPLTMYDSEKNKIAYAGDELNITFQRVHQIFVDDEMSAKMVRRGNSFKKIYDIYNKDGAKIARVKFNRWNTNGEMYDMEENLIADFNSKWFSIDFDVRITENCDLDEKTVLMIFCAYHSDCF